MITFWWSKENQPFSQMKVLLVEGDRGREPGEKGVGDVRKGGVKVAGSGIPNVEVGGRNGKIGGGRKLPLP